MKHVPRKSELMVKSRRMASLCQSLVNSTSACRPYVFTSTRKVVISKFDFFKEFIQRSLLIKHFSQEANTTDKIMSQTILIDAFQLF